MKSTVKCHTIKGKCDFETQSQETKHNLDKNYAMFEIITLCMTYDTDECDFHVKYLENKTIHRSIQMFILSIRQNIKVLDIIIFTLSRFINGLL